MCLHECLINCVYTLTSVGALSTVIVLYVCVFVYLLTKFLGFLHVPLKLLTRHMHTHDTNTVSLVLVHVCLVAKKKKVSLS